MYDLQLIFLSSGITELNTATVSDDTLCRNSDEILQFKHIFGEQNVGIAYHNNLSVEFKDNYINILWNDLDDNVFEKRAYSGKYYIRYKG